MGANFIMYDEQRHKVAMPVTNKVQYLNLRDSVKNRNAMKKNMVQFNYNLASPQPAEASGKTPAAFPLKGATTVGNSVGMDVDLKIPADLTQEEGAQWLEAKKQETEKKILDKKDELGLLMLERSATKGFHLVFRRHPEMSQVENLCWASNLLGVEFDEQAKDVTRVFYTPTTDHLIYLDEELFREEALSPTQPLSLTQPLSPSPFPHKGARGVESTAIEKGKDTTEVISANDNPVGDTEVISANDKPVGDTEVISANDKPVGDTEVISANDKPVGDTEVISASDKPVGDTEVTTPLAPSSKGAKGERGSEAGGRGCYYGIPYSSIIAKYWEMFYGGKTPVVSNRDTLTYELANVMKHICGFDRNVLGKVIPCYDGFPEAEKMKCIDSALSGKRTQMPKRLRDVLEAMRREELLGDKKNSHYGELDLALEEVFADDELFYYKRLPKGVMVQGISDAFDAAGHQLAMPVIAAICPAIGARATNVYLKVHNKARNLNLSSFIVGDSASCKGSMDDVVMAYMDEDIRMAKMYNQQKDEWIEKMKASRNQKEQPVEPKFPKVWITMNNTVANLAVMLSRLNNCHGFSYTAEADMVSKRWKQSISDFSVMLRIAYDGGSYEREALSVDAANVHIDHLLWNVVMCGTNDALHRVVNNCTDGLQTRIAIARTPDNTYLPLEEDTPEMTDLQRDHIIQVSHLLPLLKGVLDLKKLEAKGREWLEEVRLEAMKNDDKVRARQRMRVCVTTQRMVCCMMMVAVCAKLIKEHGVSGAENLLRMDNTLWMKMMEDMQTPDFMELFDIIADSLIDNNMYFFGERIRQAMSSSNYCGGYNTQSGNRSRKGGNDSIYSLLPQEFTYAEAKSQSIASKGSLVTENAVRQMLKNWLKQGLVSATPEGRYRKV